MLHAALRALVLEFDDTAFRGNGLDRCHAELHGFLQGDVHAIAARKPLHELNVQAGLALDVQMRAGLD